MDIIIFIIVLSIPIITGLFWAYERGGKDYVEEAIAMYIPLAILGWSLGVLSIIWIWEKTNSEFDWRTLFGWVSIIFMVGFVARIVMADHKKD